MFICVGAKGALGDELVYNICVYYALENENEARLLCGFLNKIVQFNAYAMEMCPGGGEDCQRLGEGLSKSVFAVLLLGSGKNFGSWFEALGKCVSENVKKLCVVPVGELGLKEQVCLPSQGNVDVLPSHSGSFEQVIPKIVCALRSQITKGHKEKGLHFLVFCQNCSADLEKEFTYKVILPSTDALLRFVSSSSSLVQTSCPRCRFYNDVDMQTLQTVRSRSEGFFNALLQ